MIEKPTVKELLNHAENRYALVIATAKRARQIAKGEEKLTDVDEQSPVTIAANEIAENKVTICGYKKQANQDEEIASETKSEE